MTAGRCPLHCHEHGCVSRREFLVGSAMFLAGCTSLRNERAAVTPIRPCGPAAKYRPTLWAAFVRREGDYGMLWPGAVYDGEKARGMYADKMVEVGIYLTDVATTCSVGGYGRLPCYVAGVRGPLRDRGIVPGLPVPVE
ncbi:MAG TPA: hypothetical protein VLI39_01750, partial [Sedimentisphaerales bacterium]|nr:hypothetical protein [Sedimentisphaerales bacterium]